MNDSSTKQWNSFFILFTFFLDEKSNKKIKSERQILFLHAQKAHALIAVKIKFHTVHPCLRTRKNKHINF